LIGAHNIGTAWAVNGPAPGAHSVQDIVGFSFYPDDTLRSDIFWRHIDDAASQAVRRLNAEGPVSFAIFPNDNSMTLRGGQLFAVFSDPDDTTFVMRLKFQSASDIPI
jgi:hypothetical protein